ncbi:hypothetical protein TI39_contig378g00024 [Zymoseptoria brevis]|uniref:Uncharacterized protein n=1 Tax=Zymoseptoria brevis TaxID=1047168 RepID=A0A0F4GS47_9PEZI|nr:hypothetical protein TI39_contig378g00024 [Zymoseptoria brevis]
MSVELELVLLWVLGVTFFSSRVGPVRNLYDEDLHLWLFAPVLLSLGLRLASAIYLPLCVVSKRAFAAFLAALRSLLAAAGHSLARDLSNLAIELAVVLAISCAIFVFAPWICCVELRPRPALCPEEAKTRVSPPASPPAAPPVSLPASLPELQISTALPGPQISTALPGPPIATPLPVLPISTRLPLPAPAPTPTPISMPTAAVTTGPASCPRLEEVVEEEVEASPAPIPVTAPPSLPSAPATAPPPSSLALPTTSSPPVTLPAASSPAPARTTAPVSSPPAPPLATIIRKKETVRAPRRLLSARFTPIGSSARRPQTFRHRTIQTHSLRVEWRAEQLVKEVRRAQPSLPVTALPPAAEPMASEPISEEISEEMNLDGANEEESVVAVSASEMEAGEQEMDGVEASSSLPVAHSPPAPAEIAARLPAAAISAISRQQEIETVVAEFVTACQILEHLLDPYVMGEVYDIPGRYGLYLGEKLPEWHQVASAVARMREVKGEAVAGGMGRMADVQEKAAIMSDQLWVMGGEDDGFDHFVGELEFFVGVMGDLSEIEGPRN